MPSLMCHRRCTTRDRSNVVPVPLDLPSNPDLHHRIYTRGVAVHLQQSAGEESQL